MTSAEHHTPRTLAALAAFIDHTLLNPAATRRDLERLCQEAAERRFRTVCVNPVWVPAAAALVAGTGVGVASVVAFPFGASATDVKVHEARRAIEAGAAEIDMAIHLGALKSGEVDVVRQDIAAVVDLCHPRRVLLKAIIETAALTDAEKVQAAGAAADAGADFVKTSTGFGQGGATAADVALLSRAAAGRAAVKASGGIRDLNAVLAMIEAGAARIGTSAGVRILEDARANGFR